MKLPVFLLYNLLCCFTRCCSDESELSLKVSVSFRVSQSSGSNLFRFQAEVINIEWFEPNSEPIFV